jgi:hypothetical protein
LSFIIMSHFSIENLYGAKEVKIII